MTVAANALRRPHRTLAVLVLTACGLLACAGASSATESGSTTSSSGGAPTTGSSGAPAAAKSADEAKTEKSAEAKTDKSETSGKTGEEGAEKSGEIANPLRYQGPPPPPMGLRFRLDRHVFDSTGSLAATDLSSIQSLIEEHYRLDGYPLAVVILNHLSETGDSSGSLEEVGLQLLAQLQAGRRNPEYAVVMILALKDEKLRVQKGLAWGTRYDMSVQEVIDQVIIPRLKHRDREGNERQVDVAAAIRAGVAELVSVLHQSHAAEQPLFVPVGRFLAKSWIWILLGLHLLGLLYVMITKESEAWYVAGFLFGLPILLGMLCWMLGGRGSEGVQDGGEVFLGGSADRPALRSVTWTTW